MAERLDYDILTAPTAAELAEKVRQAISSGWDPRGSHQVATIRVTGHQRHPVENYTLEYSQTMTRRVSVTLQEAPDAYTAMPLGAYRDAARDATGYVRVED